MTSHELARRLLAQHNLPMKIWDDEEADWVEVKSFHLIWAEGSSFPYGIMLSPEKEIEE